MQTTTLDPITQIVNAVKFLDSRCNGTMSEDFQGFNRNDTNFGKSLCRQIDAGFKLSEAQLMGIYPILIKYQKTQLNPNGYFLPTKAELGYAIANSEEMLAKKALRIIDIYQDDVKVTFPFNKNIKECIKSLPTARYIDRGEDSKYWLVSTEYIVKLVNRLKEHSFNLTEKAKAYLAQYVQEHNEKSEEQQTLELWVEQFIAKYGSNWKFPNGNKLELFEHQKEAVKFLITRNHLHGAILADTMGLGKTISSLVTAKFLQGYYKYLNGHDVHVIVICPKSVKDDWCKAAQVLDLAVEVHTWSKVPIPPKRAKFILLSDECHYAQNINSSRTKKFLTLAHDENCLRVFPITGTPMKNGRPSNIYPLLVAINHPIASDRIKFEKRYCNARPTTFTKWDVTGAINLEELREETLDAIIHRKQEDCVNLPEKIEISITCEDNDKAEKEYQEAFNKLKADYQARVKEGIISNKGEAVVFLTYLRKLTSTYKTYQAIDTAESILESGSSVTIFTEFVESAEKIAKHFGVTPLTGQMKDEDRQKLKEDFQAGITKVFVGTIKAGGVGITLTAANYNLIVDFPWTVGDLEQCKARIYRIGQTKTSFIYNFYAKDIDYVIANVLEIKGENIDKVIKKFDLDVTKDLASLQADIVNKLLA